VRLGQDEAQAKVGAVNLLLLRIQQGLISVPAGVSIEEFLRQEGKVNEAKETIATAVAITTFARLKERYEEAHRHGSMEGGILLTVRIHLGHVGRTLGDAFPLKDLTIGDLQRHVKTENCR
jgi:hypothetical protein